MTLAEIKQAVDSGKKVFWGTSNYLVVKDRLNQYLIKSLCNNNCIGLTWMDGTTLNGKEDEFYMVE